MICNFMKRIFTILVFVLIAIYVSAEPNRKFNPQAYKAEQRKYITHKAKLSQKDAQIFFGIYDEMRAEERKLFSKISFNRKKQPQTEEECYKAITEKDKTEIKLKKIQQQYHQKMLKELPAKVVMKCLYFAEHFDRKKLREASAKTPRHKAKRSK